MKKVIRAGAGFDKGFALALILLCQDEEANSSAQEIVEMRCKKVLDEAGYEYNDFKNLGIDKDELKILATIYSYT